MIIAVIDLGTNTFNLLITEVFNNGTNVVVFNTKIPVMLGKESIGNNILSDAAINRAINALSTFKQYSNKYKAQKIIAKATSAIREAKNKEDFLKKVKQQTGIEIDVISGDREAEYIYYGVCNAVSLDKNNSLMMDIGGGSTEFIIANNSEVKWKKSFLLGAARLLEKFSPSNPITAEEITSIENYLITELDDLFSASRQYAIKELIGVAGVFESLADIIAQDYTMPEQLEKTTEYTFLTDDIYLTINNIIKSTREERLKMKGLIEMRVDMIVVSVLFIHVVLKTLNINKIRMSAYSLKEGVLWELINHNK